MGVFPILNVPQPFEETISSSVLCPFHLAMVGVFPFPERAANAQI